MHHFVLAHEPGGAGVKIWGELLSLVISVLIGMFHHDMLKI